MRVPCFRTVWVVLLLVTLSAPIAAQQPQADSLAEQAREFIETVNEERAAVDDLRAQLETATGEDVDVLRVRIAERQMDMLSRFEALCENILAQEADGVDASESRAFVEPLLTEAHRGLLRVFDDLTEREAKLRAQLEQASAEDKLALSTDLAQIEERVDRIVALLFENVERIERMGLPNETESAEAVALATERADGIAARIQVVQDRKAGLQAALSDEPDSATLKADVADADRRLDRLAGSLRSLAGLLDDAGVSTTGYQALLVATTGDVASGLLDKDVALTLADQWRQRFTDWIVETGPTIALRIVVVILILVLFRILGRLTRRVLRRVFASSRVRTSQLLQDTVISLASRAVFLLGVLVALSQLGVSLGPILAGLGVAGFIVGFALQDTLSNFAAGGMILFYRPFDVGDMVEAAGVFGQVRHMSLVSTTFLTIDHQTLIVPNSKIWGDVIRNVTAQKIRRVDLEFGISYTDDIPHAERVLAAILEDEPKVLEDPAPMIRLHRLGESSVDFVVRPWCKTEDYWDVHWNVTREVKMRFDREGISIPFPQRDVHLYPTNGGAGSKVAADGSAG